MSAIKQLFAKHDIWISLVSSIVAMLLSMTFCVLLLK